MRRFCATVLVVAAALALGCGSKSDDSSDDDDDDEEESGSGIGSLGMMGALLSSQMDQPGRYDEPREHKGSGNRWAIVDLSGQVGELHGFSLLGGGDTLELQPVLTRLAALAADDDVGGLILRIDGLQVD